MTHCKSFLFGEVILWITFKWFLTCIICIFRPDYICIDRKLFLLAIENIYFANAVLLITGSCIWWPLFKYVITWHKIYTIYQIKRWIAFDTSYPTLPFVSSSFTRKFADVLFNCQNYLYYIFLLQRIHIFCGFIACLLSLVSP